jgi:phosphate starvation-inducible PhoH-like protein
MNHRIYQALLENYRVPIIVAHGPAGTGKTLMACQAAASSQRHDRVIMTRPAVSVDEQHGFLPGNLNKKMEPWVAPMTDHLRFGSKKKIEVCPLAYMRGRTFDYSWILADEMQNSTPNQMRMVLTRLGKDSKLVITGDTGQHDRGFEKNGLLDLVQRLTYSPIPGIEMVKFTEEDIKRHSIIKDILRLYGP